MIVDLGEIEGASRPFEFTVAASDLDLDVPGFRLTGDVKVSGEVVKRSAQIDVEGSIVVGSEIDCTRCLKPLSQELNVEFAVSFVTPDNFSAAGDHEVSADDLDVDVLEADQIDVKQIAREQILLNVPSQTFCREDCKGLCLKCGADLNLIDCKCDLEGTDPRWEALKNLK